MGRGRRPGRVSPSKSFERNREGERPHEPLRFASRGLQAAGEREQDVLFGDDAKDGIAAGRTYDHQGLAVFSHQRQHIVGMHVCVHKEGPLHEVAGPGFVGIGLLAEHVERIQHAHATRAVLAEDRQPHMTEVAHQPRARAERNRLGRPRDAGQRRHHLRGGLRLQGQHTVDHEPLDGRDARAVFGVTDHVLDVLARHEKALVGGFAVHRHQPLGREENQMNQRRQQFFDRIEEGGHQQRASQRTRREED